MSKYAPVALFAYGRPEHTRMTVESLAANELAEETKVFIFSDAARSEKDFEAVNAVRRYLRGIKGFHDVNVVERSRNYGLADSIVEGITSVIEAHGKVIVLEDDIVTSPFFLRYMNDALDRYESVERVMHIAGYMMPIDFPSGAVSESVFLRHSSCWGWATWGRAWRHFHRNAETFIKAFTSTDRGRFNLDGAHDYWSQLLANHEGRLKTWAIYWYASIFSRGGLCLHPRSSLVRNIGFDGSGVNCGTDSAWCSELGTSPVSQFPSAYHEDEVAMEAVKRSLQGKSHTSVVAGLLRSIKAYVTR